MLQIHSTQRLDQIEMGMHRAAARHGGEVLAVSHVGRLLGAQLNPGTRDAVSFTVCFPAPSAALLDSDIRFAAFLPGRIAACIKPDGVWLEAISPREYCRMLHRPDLEPLADRMEEALRAVMEEAGHGSSHEALAREHKATEDMINMRAALPQRIDCVGTKIEELAGTGAIDTQGG